MSEQPEMIHLGTGQADAVNVTFRANWALTSPEGAPAPVRVTTTGIPPLLPREACLRCGHGLHDVAGFVVAYSHLSQAGVHFTDIVHVEGARSYAQARQFRDAAVGRIQRGEVDAAYAVIHWVYEGGHRTS
jgi:hypothetical protein